MIPHRCHAEGCDVLVPRARLMCRPHWHLVPRGLRGRLGAAYRPGQETDKRPSPAYVALAKAAIRAVAAKERPA